MAGRAVLIGDVGPVNDVFHVGDEAMLERAIEELRSRGWNEFTVVSANPQDTKSRYRVDSVASDAVIAVGDESVSSTALDALFHDVELVVVTGGGNLNDLWPEHVALRLQLCEAAQARGIDVFISGQGLGPFAANGASNDVRRLLDTAILIGVRDKQSYDLCMSWGFDPNRVVLGPDDVILERDHTLTAASSPDEPHVAGMPDEFAVASFSSWHGDLMTPEEHLDRAVLVVEDLHVITGMPVMLVPQEGSIRTDSRVADVSFHDQIAARVGKSAATSLDLMSTNDCRRVIGRSHMVVSGRYHPAVFALGAGVPAVGVGVDAYTQSKLGQALNLQGDLGVSIPSALFRRDDARAVIALVWQNRAVVRAELERIAPVLRSLQAAWWDYVSGVRSSVAREELARAEDAVRGLETSTLHFDDPVLRRIQSDGETMKRIGARIWAQSGEGRTYIASLEFHVAGMEERLQDATTYAQSLEAEITKRNLQAPSQ